MEDKIKKKKKCRPLNSFKINLDINSQNDIEYLKKFVSIFDLDPVANKLIFDKIPEYRKYLYKYQYTLAYKDAKELGCFKEEDVDKIIADINEKIKDFPKADTEYEKIEKIDSLSKIKLIHFFLYLLLLVPKYEDYQEIMNYINSLRLKTTLIFMNPINLGNYELKYYFYYEIFIELFCFNKKEIFKKKTCSEINKNIFKSENLDYFPGIINNNDDDFITVDLTKFEERKNELFNFVNENTSLKEDILEDIGNKKPKNQTIELDEEKDLKNIKDIEEAPKKAEKLNFIRKCESLKTFEKAILNMFFKGTNNEDQILEKLKFIYFYLILTLQNKNPPSTSLVNTFYMKNDTYDKNRFIIYEDIIKKLFVNSDNLLLSNIGLPGVFFENINNPFIDNFLAFPFPTIFHKNFLEYIPEIYQDFLEHLKYIYKSILIQDIYYLCPEFDDFDYPFKNDEILNEMFKNTFFIPGYSENLYGYTQKNLISIFIPTMINESDSYILEKFIIRLGFILNTTIHEQLKHYIKALIFFNSFKFGLKKHIESDEDLDNDENIFLNGLMKKRKKKKKISLNGKDGGHRAEILLYGQVLERISCIQGLKMFYKSTWNTSIKKHFCDFNDNYGIEKKNKDIDNESFFGLNIVFNDDDVCPFFKKILRKFTDCKNIKSEKALIDLKYSANKEPENCDNKLELNINLNFEEDMKRPDVRDYSP